MPNVLDVSLSLKCCSSKKTCLEGESNPPQFNLKYSFTKALLACLGIT